jgi:hypothetical protein
MSNAEDQIRSRVDAFVNELSDLVREAALQAVADALKKGEPSAAPARKAGRPAKAAPVSLREETTCSPRPRPAAAGRRARRALPAGPSAQ